MSQKKEYELLFSLQASLGSNFTSTLSAAQKATQTLQTNIKNLNTTASDISSFQKKAEALDLNQEKMAKLQEEYYGLQQEMDAVETPTKSLTKEFEKKQAEIEKLNSVMKAQQDNLDTLGTKLESAGVDTSNLTDETERYSRELQNAMTIQQNYNDLTKLQEANTANIAKTQKQLATAVGVTAAAGASLYAFAVKPTMEYEAQMSVVQSITNASAEEMELLSATAKEMGQTTSFSATQSAEAMEYLGMAGWNVQQSIDGLPGVLALAAASGEDLGNTADIVSNGLSAFGMEVSESSHFADVLAQASRSANTDVSLMGETFEKVGTVAGALGYSLEDVSLAATAMASVGLNGAEAGTALKSSFANLAAPTNAMATAMDKYGISITNTDGTMKPLKDLIDDMRVSFSDLSEAEQVSAATTIFGKEAMGGMLSIINASEDEYDRLTEAIYNSSGAAQEMADIRMDNLDGDMQLLSSATESLQLALGEVLLPTIREVTQKATELVVKMAQFAAENPALVATILKISAGLAALVIGGLSAKLAFQKVYGVFLSIGKALTLLQGNAFFNQLLKFGTMAAKLMPMVGIFLAIGAAIYYVATHLEEVRAFIENTFGSEALAVFDTFVGMIQAIGDAVKMVFSGDVEGARGIIESTFGESGVIIFEAFLGVIESVKEAIPWLLDNIMALGAILGPLLMELGATLLPLIIDVGGLLIGLVGVLFVALLPVLATIGELAANILPILIAALTFVVQVIGTLAQTVIPILVEVIQFLVPYITILAEVLTVVLGGAFNVAAGLVDAFLTVLNGIIQFVTGVFTGNWEQAWEGVKTIFSGVFDGIKAVCTGVMNTIVSAMNTVISGLNKLTIPDWVPGIGGQGINIPLIPQFAKGTNFTPDTFIAGEAGAELITGAAGRKVFTAAQTGQIFQNLNKAEAMAEAMGKKNAEQPSTAAEVQTIVMIAPALQQALEAQKSANTQETQQPQNATYIATMLPALTANVTASTRAEEMTGSAVVQAETLSPSLAQYGQGESREVSVVINSSPVFNVGSGTQIEDLEEMMQKHDEELTEKFKRRLEEEEEDRKRRGYD